MSNPVKKKIEELKEREMKQEDFLKFLDKIMKELGIEKNEN